MENLHPKAAIERVTPRPNAPVRDCLKAVRSRRRFLESAAAAAGCAVLGLPSQTPGDEVHVPAAQPAARSFFRVEQRNGKWFLIDPLGKPLHMRGANHYGNGSLTPWNMNQRYGGQRARWMAELCRRHRDWGFTFLAPSIGGLNPDPGQKPDWPRPAETNQDWTAEERIAADLPCTPFLGVPRENMSGVKEGMGDVWSEEFISAVDARCRELVAPLKDSPLVIGYHFAHNPPWNNRAPSFNQWIADCTKPGSPGLDQWVQLMQRIYVTIDRWREVYGVPIQDWSDIGKQRILYGYIDSRKQLEDTDAFMRLICEQWYRVYHDTIRKYDPKHLILGDRNTLHLQPPLQPWAIDIIRRYVDVLSVNIMGPPSTAYDLLELASRHWDGPILLADTGATVYTDRQPKRCGYQGKDLAEWEACYSGLMTMSLDHPQIIGFGWCGWYETPDGHPSNRAGLVDCRSDEPLADRVAIVTKWNRWIDERFGNQL